MPKKTIADLINIFIDIFSTLIPFLAALAFFLFMLGVAKYIRSSGSEKDAKDSKNLLIWGIVGIFILVTIWGIISFMRSELGFGAGVVLPRISF